MAGALAFVPSARAVEPPPSLAERLALAADAPSSLDSGIGASAAEVAKLRRQVGSKSVRVWLARGALQFPRADLDTVGIRFDVSRQRVVAARPMAQPHASPLPWNEVGRLDVRNSHVRAGSLIGAGVGLVFVPAIFKYEPAPHIAAFAGSIGLGAGVGWLFSGWKTAWRRPPGEGPPQPATSVPSQPVPVLRHHPASPSRALAIGLGTTLALPVAAAGLDAALGGSIPLGGALALGGEAGVLVGPAVGLTAGGRWDLAKRGLIIRSAGAAGGAVVVGLGFAVAIEGNDRSAAA